MSFSLSDFRRAAVSEPMKLVYSALILLNHFSFGINVNILGATLVDLRFIYGVPIDTISYVPVCVGVGYLLGALAGFLYRWLNRQLMLSLFVAAMGATLGLVPHYGALAFAFPFFVLNGVGAGAWDSASGFWIVEMWPQGNDMLLQLVQFCYGVGSVVAPLIVAPYVSGEKTNFTDSKTGQMINITAEDRVHALTVPFAGIGAALLLVPLIMLLLFIAHRYEQQKPSSTVAPAPPVVAPTSSPVLKEAGGSGNHLSGGSGLITKVDSSGNVVLPLSSMPFRIVKLAMCGLCLACYATAELGWFGFSSAMYQYLPEMDDGGAEDGEKMDATKAAHVQSVLSATFTSGRLLTAFITLRLVPDVIISYHYLISFTALGTLFFGRGSLVAVYVGSALLGAGYSAMWPAILAFAERHLALSDRVCSSYSFLTGLMSMVPPLVLGQISLKEHPLTLFALEAAFLTFSFLLFTTVRLWLWLEGGSRANGRYS